MKTSKSPKGLTRPLAFALGTAAGPALTLLIFLEKNPVFNPFGVFSASTILLVTAEIVLDIHIKHLTALREDKSSIYLGRNVVRGLFAGAALTFAVQLAAAKNPRDLLPTWLAFSDNKIEIMNRAPLQTSQRGISIKQNKVVLALAK